MSPKSDAQAEEERTRQTGPCPICEIFDFVFNLPGDDLEHFRQSKIEFWRGIKALIDRRIDSLEKAGGKGSSRARKVKVE